MSAPPLDGPTKEGGSTMVQSLKLFVGVVGIYGAFMYYGVLQSAITRFESKATGERLEREWFLQSVEAFANVLVGFLGLMLLQGGPSPSIPFRGFAVSGMAQVMAKAMTQKAMIFGVPFFLATLVKNAKMVPVMIGAIVLAGKSYAPRKYVQVGLIIAGVVLVSVYKKKKKKSGGGGGGGGGEHASHDDTLGMVCLAVSLMCDGLVAGTQDSMKKGYEEKMGKGKKLQPYDLMMFTNLFMLLIAVAAALGLDQFWGGVAFVRSNPEMLVKVAQFAACSALGQSAIFFTIANFDPLVCTTVTTTRKIFSVLLDIAVSGHVLVTEQWGGVALATLGVIGELQEKFGRSSAKVKAK